MAPGRAQSACLKASKSGPARPRKAQRPTRPASSVGDQQKFEQRAPEALNVAARGVHAGGPPAMRNIVLMPHRDGVINFAQIPTNQLVYTLKALAAVARRLGLQPSFND